MKIITTEIFDKWLEKLKDDQARQKIQVRIRRIQNHDYFGDFKFVGDEIYELRIHYGPGYRVYYTIQKGEVTIILVGGDKSEQKTDISAAKEIWRMIKK